MKRRSDFSLLLALLTPFFLLFSTLTAQAQTNLRAFAFPASISLGAVEEGVPTMRFSFVISCFPKSLEGDISFPALYQIDPISLDSGSTKLFYDAHTLLQFNDLIQEIELGEPIDQAIQNRPLLSELSDSPIVMDIDFSFLRTYCPDDVSLIVFEGSPSQKKLVGHLSINVFFQTIEEFAATSNAYGGGVVSQAIETTATDSKGIKHSLDAHLYFLFFPAE